MSRGELLRGVSLDIRREIVAAEEPEGGVRESQLPVGERGTVGGGVVGADHAPDRDHVGVEIHVI